MARALRQGGYRVVLAHPTGNSPQAVRLMLEEGKRLEAQVTALVGSTDVSSDAVLIVSASPKVQQRTVKIKELPSLLRP